MRTTEQPLPRTHSFLELGTANVELPEKRKWVPRLALGGALNLVAWGSAWTQAGPLAHRSFFPLWLGFILVVDALTEARSGTSLWRRRSAGCSWGWAW